ncbi:MAG TPA: phosphatase PAP2 family protein [Candidatus Sulfotelmatobacter sp.]|nr:phosphatase PAP2 family protein [Candidatus Sulfotelmatobacter sp.]
MADRLIGWDRWLFEAVNHGHRNAVFDAVMPALERKATLLLAAVLAGAALLVWGGAKGRWTAATAVLAILLADQAAGWVKFLVARPRPCHVLPAVTLLNTGCTGSYAFPSNHATNLFALAVVVGGLYPRWAWAFVPFAAAVSYARVYGGAHYPGDVLGGAVLGAALGALALAGTQAIRRALGRAPRAGGATSPTRDP